MSDPSTIYLKLVDLASEGKVVSPADLNAAFDALQPIQTTELLTRSGGEWNGQAFPRDTDELYDKMVEMKWAGKTFNEVDNVDPMVLYSDPENPQKRVASANFGKAILREIKHRGVYTIGMIYDTAPIIDYFRFINENTIAGVMDSKQYKGLPDFHFILRRTRVM